MLVISSGTERALLIGDVAHCPVELLDPEWEAISDVDPDLARRTREALARSTRAPTFPWPRHISPACSSAGCSPPRDAANG